MATTGDRVGAIISVRVEPVRLEPVKEVTFAGYGVYKGDEIPPKGIGIMGMDLNEMGRSNPRIDLDDGTTIWGCQCWWGPECQVEKMMENYKNEGYQITQADPDEYAPILAGETE